MPLAYVFRNPPHYATAAALVLFVVVGMGGDSAPLSPVDFCIAWGGLTDPRALRFLDISQGSRWCNWRIQEEFPYDDGYVIRNSANVHIVPSSKALDRAARRVRRHDDEEAAIVHRHEALRGELVPLHLHRLQR